MRVGRCGDVGLSERKGRFWDPGLVATLLPLPSSEIGEDVGGRYIPTGGDIRLWKFLFVLSGVVLGPPLVSQADESGVLSDTAGPRVSTLIFFGPWPLGPG